MSKQLILSEQFIENKIYFIRGKKVMLDRDLAEMYGVTTGNLNKAVKRNLNRFPEEFVFQLTKEELRNLIFQIGISKKDRINLKFQFGTSSWGGTRKLPYAFTEHGVPMLATVIRSERADKITILVIKTFVKVGEIIANNKEIAAKLKELESKSDKHDKEIQLIFQAIKELIETKKSDATPRKQVGYKYLQTEK